MDQSEAGGFFHQEIQSFVIFRNAPCVLTVHQAIRCQGIVRGEDIRAVFRKTVTFLGSQWRPFESRPWKLNVYLDPRC
jgi:hypothetical protein